MKFYLTEKIGNPELFTGRKKELAFLLKWVARIKRERSKSTAVLSRRKTGKSALMQRLYNIVFHNDDGVVPFYFEIRETDQWLGTFCEDFFLTFIYQYIAFKTRDKKYLTIAVKKDFEEAVIICREKGLDYLVNLIEEVHSRYRQEDADAMWDLVRDAPRKVAEYKDESVVQMIDEFQHINRFIFKDKEGTRRADKLAGSYLHTAEYRNAPLLISGSWIGWLMNDLITLLPGRFKTHHLQNVPEDEAIEMIFKYSLMAKVPVTEQTVFLIARLTEGNPFYISVLFDSNCPEKDLATEEGVLKTLEFETLDTGGEIRGTWLEYIHSALPHLNEKHTKDIVLYLSEHRDRHVSRKELKQSLDMTDIELDRKLEALLRSDIIEENRFQYRGVQDNIFDKVFRCRYSDDIDKFVTRELAAEYKALFEQILAKYKRLSGKHKRCKGAFAEFTICGHLRSSACKNNALFASMLGGNPPKNFKFVEYEKVWSYASPPLHEPEFQIDVFARAGPENYSLIGEVKNRQAKFSLKEAKQFRQKARALMELEGIQKAVLFVFSVNGFHKNTLGYLKKHKIAWTDDARWLV